MKEKLRKNTSLILLFLAELIVGILLLINPESFTAWIVIGTGILAMIGGILDIIRYMKLPPTAAAQQRLLSKGLMLILIGAGLALKYSWFREVFPLLAVLYGAGLLISGVARIQRTVDLLRMKRPHWTMMAVSAIVTTIMAFIILLHPNFVQSILWAFVSVSLFIGAALDLVNIILDLREKAA